MVFPRWLCSREICRECTVWAKEPRSGGPSTLGPDFSSRRLSEKISVWRDLLSQVEGTICPARSGGSYGHDHRGGTSRSFWSQPRLLKPSSKPELPLQGNCTPWSGSFHLVWRLPDRPSQLPSWYSSGVPAGPFLHKVDPLHLRGLRGGHCGLTLQKLAFGTRSPPTLATPGSLFSRPSCALPQYTKRGFESLAAWVSRSTQLDFLKRNVSDYICNPSSSRERDAASRGHTSGIPSSACFIPRSWRRFHRTCFYSSWSLRHPARDISLIHWSDYTRYSECGHAEGVPKGFDAASRSFTEYVTETFSFTKVYKELNGNKEMLFNHSQWDQKHLLQ